MLFTSIWAAMAQTMPIGAALFARLLIKVLGTYTANKQCTWSIKESNDYEVSGVYG